MHQNILSNKFRHGKKVILASILATYSHIPLAHVQGQNFTSVQVYLTILKHLLNICIHVNIAAWQLKQKSQSFTPLRFKISAAISKCFKKK